MRSGGRSVGVCKLSISAPLSLDLVASDSLALSQCIGILIRRTSGLQVGQTYGWLSSSSIGFGPTCSVKSDIMAVVSIIRYTSLCVMMMMIGGGGGSDPEPVTTSHMVAVVFVADTVTMLDCSLTIQILTRLKSKNTSY